MTDAKGQWDQHNEAVEQICQQAVEELRRIMLANPLMSREQLRAVLKRLNDKWAGVAAQHAIDTMLVARAMHQKSGLPVPQGQSIMSLEMADAIIRYASKADTPEAVLDKISRSLIRNVRNGSRRTVRAATDAAKTRFARIPRAGACAFCLMLASRGAVYSRDTVTQARQKDRYHDNCKCSAQEVLDPRQEPEELTRLREEWEKTSSELSKLSISYGDWGAVVRKIRDRDAADLVTMERLLETLETPRMRKGTVQDHVLSLRVKKERISGGHLHSFIGEVAHLVKSGEVQLADPKTFFPDLPPSVILDWLGDETKGAIHQAISNPDQRVFKGNGITAFFEKDLELNGRRIRIRVVMSRAETKSVKWSISSVFPMYGDDVYKVMPNGAIVQAPWIDSAG